MDVHRQTMGLLVFLYSHTILGCFPDQSRPLIKCYNFITHWGFCCNIFIQYMLYLMYQQKPYKTFICYWLMTSQLMHFQTISLWYLRISCGAAIIQKYADQFNNKAGHLPVISDAEYEAPWSNSQGRQNLSSYMKTLVVKFRYSFMNFSLGSLVLLQASSVPTVAMLHWSGWRLLLMIRDIHTTHLLVWSSSLEED